ncbi:MAG: hypothetical protein JNL09_04810 [Anaerolineales bacterium]|nr:hypothetical protein [Anaerolineales bacterium]
MTHRFLTHNSPPAMFAKHLPPSAGLPRVLVLDEASQRELPVEIESMPEGAEADAVVGCVPPHNLEQWFGRLRPGGRIILAHAAPAEELLAALTAAGFVHCLVEPLANGLTLYRGERPPLNSSTERLNSLISNSQTISPFLFLLVHQTPNKPVWKLTPDEMLAWRAACVRNPFTEQPTLLAFSSLVKAVAFMQKAVLAQWLVGINKVGKFPSQAVQTWPAPIILNPEFEAVRAWAIETPVNIDPHTAITGDE